MSEVKSNKAWRLECERLTTDINSCRNKIDRLTSQNNVLHNDNLRLGTCIINQGLTITRQQDAINVLLEDCRRHIAERESWKAKYEREYSTTPNPLCRSMA